MAGHRYRDGSWVTVDNHGGDGFLPDGTADNQLLDASPAHVSDDVPAGPAAAVLDWVGTDGHRAALARAVELDRARPRSTVLDVTARLVGDA